MAVSRAKRRWRAVALVEALLLAVLLAWVLAGRAPREARVEEPADDSPRVALSRADIEELPGWRQDDPAEAIAALLRSCAAWERRGRWPPGAGGVEVPAAAWLRVCSRAAGLRGETASWAHGFFAAEFEAFELSDRGEARGLFTGYYDPTVRGSLERRAPYVHPLYRRPPELVEVELGSFRDDLGGRRLAGAVEGGRLRPFADRAAIDRGALAGRGLELVWLDDPVDLFFLQIQGSGRVELREGGSLRVGYAGQNGHPYVAIGRELVARGELALEEVSMQSIRAWLEARPDEAAELMARNPSFVFFRRLEGDGPRGSLGIELTPERSIAVDRRFVPLGAPLWVETTLPSAAGVEGAGGPWRRLVLAQDTGGAIRGPVRADIFWGSGPRAEELAGRMRQEGRLWLLLPRSASPENASRHPGIPAARPARRPVENRGR